MHWLDPSNFDPVVANERALQCGDVLQRIRLGLITVDNIDKEQRQIIRDYFRGKPVAYRDEATGLVEVTGEEDWREGTDWCFATSDDGVFGVFALRPPLHALVRQATFHLWPADFCYQPELEDSDRQDFSDLHLYQDAALEYSLAAAA